MNRISLPVPMESALPQYNIPPEEPMTEGERRDYLRFTKEILEGLEEWESGRKKVDRMGAKGN